MPTATPELRNEWGYGDDQQAMQYLKNHGYKLQRNWTWLCPEGHEPTAKETRAVVYLIQEWDMDGIVKTSFPSEREIADAEARRD